MSEKMTAAQAQTFEHGQSTGSTLLLSLAAEKRGCDCQPYVDWFTYKRWKAQGMQVQRGEKSVKLTVYVPNKPNEDGESTGTHPWHSSVFCRCQVKPVEERH